MKIRLIQVPEATCPCLLLPTTAATLAGSSLHASSAGSKQTAGELFCSGAWVTCLLAGPKLKELGQLRLPLTLIVLLVCLQP